MTLIRDFEFPARADASSDTYLPDYDEMREDARREAAAYLKDNEDFLVAEGVRTVSILTIEGAVAKEIIGYAQTAPGAVIAMSTHGCSGGSNVGYPAASVKKSCVTPTIRFWWYGGNEINRALRTTDRNLDLGRLLIISTNSTMLSLWE